MEVEYEVETVLKAKVFMKGKKMDWKFYVKWKGYQDTDNTWEPFKSFKNCGEEIIERFWDRVDTKGRDVNSIEGWTNGEEIYPIGPPRRKSRTTLRKDETANARPSADEHPSPKGTTNGAKAKRPLESLESPGSSKRKRATSSRRKSDTRATRRSQRESRIPIPDSQSEDELLMVAMQKRKTAADDTYIDVDASDLEDQVDHKNAIKSSSRGQSEEPGHHGRPSRVSNNTKSQPSTSTMVDDIDFSADSGLHHEVDLPQGLFAPQTRSAKNVRKGLRGRNASLLTFSKKTGSLETLRRNRASKDNEAVGDADEVEPVESTSAALDSVVFHPGSSSMEIPPPGRDSTPTATEQMKFASYDDTESHSLPEYEEQNQFCPSSPKIDLPDKMPTSISFPEPLSGGSSPWKRATIFGPLAIGAGSPTWATSWASDTGLPSSISQPFLLNFDNSISVPVALKDVSSAQAIHHIHLESIVSGTAGPPGKLYTSQAATALLETLETGGSCARLVPGETATVEQRRIFDAFCTKLGEGGLFVVMASSEVLACCSSTNEDYVERLALATALRGLTETVVVSHVKVANYSAFADAAAQAETVRW